MDWLLKYLFDFKKQVASKKKVVPAGLITPDSITNYLHIDGAEKSLVFVPLTTKHPTKISIHNGHVMAKKTAEPGKPVTLPISKRLEELLQSEPLLIKRYVLKNNTEKIIDAYTTDTTSILPTIPDKSTIFVSPKEQSHKIKILYRMITHKDFYVPKKTMPVQVPSQIWHYLQRGKYFVGNKKTSFVKNYFSPILSHDDQNNEYISRKSLFQAGELLREFNHKTLLFAKKYASLIDDGVSHAKAVNKLYKEDGFLSVRSKSDVNELLRVVKKKYDLNLPRSKKRG